jgi:hypothetical protein
MIFFYIEKYIKWIYMTNTYLIKQKSIVKIFFGRKMGPLGNWALCLSTTNHNGKSGTADIQLPVNVDI